MKKIIINFLLFQITMSSAATQIFNANDLQTLQAALSQQTNQNGTLEKIFGSNGITILSSHIGGGIQDYLWNMLIDNNQKIICTGRSFINGSVYFSIARFNSSGSLDTSFNNLGTNSFAGTNYIPFSISGRTNSTDEAYSSLINNNKYVLGGYTKTQTGDLKFALAQFTKEGLLDSTFGNNGTTYIPTSITGAGNNSIFTLSKQTDNKIIAAGNSNGRFAVARFLQNGTLDSTFGSDKTGFTFINAFISGVGNDFCYASGIQSNGNIILAGRSNNFMAIACFTPTGILNQNFGSNGTGYNFITPKITAGIVDVANSLIIQPDDKIILAGYSKDINLNEHFALARFESNGILDTTFGNNGTIYIQNSIAGGTLDTCYSVQLQSDGKIIVSGRSNSQYALARFYSNGQLDTTFGTNGIGFITATNLNAAQALALTGTTIIAAGSRIYNNFFSLVSLSNIPVKSTVGL